MSAGPWIDPVSGAARVTRTDLADLVPAHADSDPPPGIDRQAYAQLVPVLDTLAAARGRATIRRWAGRQEPTIEVVVGDTGIVVLPGGTGADDIQEPRWHPRPTALARILAVLLGQPARSGPPPIGPGPHRWQDLVDRAEDPVGELVLVDLRWASPVTAPPASVMVLLWHAAGGIVELLPADEGELGVRGVEPLEVWTALTTLASTVSSPLAST